MTAAARAHADCAGERRSMSEAYPRRPMRSVAIARQGGVLGLLLLLPGAGIVWAAPTEVPGFNCAYARSRVEHLICATPELAALDRQLVEIFDNTRFQGGIDAKVLHREEDHWRLAIRDTCADVACVRRAYDERIEAVRQDSLRAASPAAYADTRDFPAPAGLLAELRRMIGTSCAPMLDPDARTAAGLQPIAGFQPIAMRTAIVQPLQKNGSRFVFLLQTVEQDRDACRLRDVAALPAGGVANALLVCDMHQPDYTSFPGIGMRLAGDPQMVAYWTIDIDALKLRREAINVIPGGATVRCRQPESGE